MEVARLNSSMADEESDFNHEIARLALTNPLLCSEVREHWDHCYQLNQTHWHKLAKLFALPGFTGSSQVGTRAGHSPLVIRIPKYVPSHAQDASHLNEESDGNDVEGDDDDDDYEEEEITHLEDFVKNLSLDSNGE